MAAEFPKQQPGLNYLTEGRGARWPSPLGLVHAG